MNMASKNDKPIWQYPVLTDRGDGSRWRLNEPTKTSDGFYVSMGTRIDEHGEAIEDTMGFPVIHEFFLG